MPLCTGAVENQHTKRSTANLRERYSTQARVNVPIMGIRVHPTGTSTRSNEQTKLTPSSSRDTTPPCSNAAVLQVDGSDEHDRSIPAGSGPHRSSRSQYQGPVIAPLPSTSQGCTTRLAVRDLLPYCTTVPPLKESQVIALSDVAGSLQEMVLLALGAVSGESGCGRRLEKAVGDQAAAHIAEFFRDEWELEG